MLLFSFIAAAILFFSIKAIYLHIEYRNSMQQYKHYISGSHYVSQIPVTFKADDNIFNPSKWAFISKCDLYVFDDHLTMVLFRTFPLRLLVKALVIKSRTTTNDSVQNYYEQLYPIKFKKSLSSNGYFRIFVLLENKDGVRFNVELNLLKETESELVNKLGKWCN